MSGKSKVHMINFLLFTKVDKKKASIGNFCKAIIVERRFFSEWRQDGTICLRTVVRTDSLSSKACQCDCNDTLERWCRLCHFDTVM